jgi:hypothetical protein
MEKSMDIVIHMITKCNQTLRQLNSATHTHTQSHTQKHNRLNAHSNSKLDI